MKTRALCFVEPRKVEIRERQLPPLGPNQVLVRVRACGICRGDVAAYRGALPSVEYPSYPGHEGAGVVEDVGSAVNRLSLGDNVAGLGSGWFAEHNVTSASNAARIPDRIEDWSRWVLEPLACCINGVDVAGIMADDVIGVVGCGFMGLGLLRCLIASPARLRVGFDVRPDRLQLARENGADAAFDVDSPQLHQALEDLIRRRPMRTTFGSSSAANGPFDVVFEAAGDPRALNMAAQLLRVGGTLVMFGFQHGRVSVDAQMWHLKGIRVLNASPMIAADFHQIFYRTVGLVERGVVDMDGLITHKRGLDGAASTLEMADRPEYLKGVVLF